MRFQTDRKYSRADVMEAVGSDRSVKGGKWFTGVVEHDGEFFIFANVGTTGRTGHDYKNRWDDEYLRWYHRSNSRIHWQSVGRLLEPGRAIHLFSRTDDRDRFKYHGFAVPMEVVEGSSPVEISLAVIDGVPKADDFGVTELKIRNRHIEGAPRRVEVTRYERDRRARQECIDHYLPTCVVCQLTFEDRYGKIGRGYIQVHHLVPISRWGNDYECDPIRDLRPICPNCHAMVHQRNPPYSVEYVRRVLTA